MKRNNIVQMNGMVVVTAFNILNVSSFIFLFRVNSPHNRDVTNKVIKEVIDAGEYSSEKSIACKTNRFKRELI